MKFFPRKLEKKIAEFIECPDIIVIHGARQVGKTTLLKRLMEQISKSNTSESHIKYLDLEDFTYLDLCNSGSDAVINHLKASGLDLSQKVYLFIDEIQYLKNPSSFLKLFHDRYKDNVKLFVSGSSSFAIRAKFKDSLVGRTVDFELFGLDFSEFLDFKGEGGIKFEYASPPITKRLVQYYREFALYGGYPRIVLEDSVPKKEVFLKQIINTYINKDIREFLNIREPGKLRNLIRALAAQTTGLCNILELSNTLKISRKTVEEYIFILENTYIVKRVPPFHENLRSELSKMAKIYFEDTGLMNIILHGTFSPSLLFTGEVFENSIFSILRKNLDNNSLYFWRTNKGQEVDFVVVDKGRKYPIEVKTTFSGRRMSGLKYFVKNYQLTEGWCVTVNADPNWKGKGVRAIYPWELLSNLNLS